LSPNIKQSSHQRDADNNNSLQDKGMLEVKQEADELFKQGIQKFKDRNYSKAVEFLQKAADKGSADAMNKLAYCYEYGYGVEKDYGKAADFLKTST
jgi:TPR repeat protein